MKNFKQKKLLLLGGGNIGFSLAQFIESSNSNISTELIEANKSRAEFLASNLNRVNITHGDGLDNQILEEVNISEAGYCIAVTEDDEVKFPFSTSSFKFFSVMLIIF